MTVKAMALRHWLTTIQNMAARAEYVSEVLGTLSLRGVDSSAEASDVLVENDIITSVPPRSDRMVSRINQVIKTVVATRMLD